MLEAEDGRFVLYEYLEASNDRHPDTFIIISPCDRFLGLLLQSSFPPCQVYASRSAHHYNALQLILV